MITSVKIKNWKSHRETEIRFGDGTNVLVGSMGSGKSSVLEAITYALFGTLPGVQSRRIKLEDLITSRPRALDQAEVEVSFIAPDGNEYTVKRVIERGRGTAMSELRKATGEVVESPSAGRVSELIKKLLELDYDLFERAIYSEQNRLDYFLTLPRGKRMEGIDELLGINKLEKARRGTGTLANRANDRADERERTAKQLRQDPSIAQLATYERELKDLESARREISERLRQLQPELESTRVQVQQSRKTEQEIAQLEQTYRELCGGIGELKHQLDEIGKRLGTAAELEPDELQKQVVELERVCNEKTFRWNQLNSALTAATSKLQVLETQKTMLQGELDKIVTELERKRKLGEELRRLKPKELDDEIEKAQLELRSIEDQLATSRAKIQELKRSMEELAGAGPTCPVCESPLGDAKKQELLRQRREQLEGLIRHVNELEPRLKQLNDDLRQKLELQRKGMLLEREVEGVSELEEERSGISGRLGGVEVEIARTRGESEKLKMETEGTRRELDEFYEKLSGMKQLFQLRMDLDAKKTEYGRKLAEGERVHRALEGLRRIHDEKKAEEIRKRLEELIGTYERLSAELSGNERLASEKKKLVEGVHEKLELISRYEAEARHLRGAAQALATIQTAFARTQVSMRRMFIDGVNEVMSDLWDSIYPYGDFVGVQLSVEGNERSGDYVLKLRDRAGNWVPVEGIASGGERTDACLALRIAFSIVLAPNLKWIVFDEPTHNLDAEGIQELAKILRDRLPEVVQQILIITHEERLESAVSGYLYRFSRDKDADEPTRVKQVTVPEVFE
ncbi:MAG TPA: hypothetical protein EYP46_00460 [Hadesarchaea archaeon]|nr:hypothetical protein [Hadesarchaea archaeon]